jgi:hypothetical protein
MGSGSNVVLAVVLAFLFGPFGLLYSTLLGALVMFFVHGALVVVQADIVPWWLITWTVNVIWGGMAASSRS